VTTWHWKVNHACGFVTTDPSGRAREEEARLKSELSANQKVFTVDVPTNAWGMPALMDERSVVGYRDGIDVTSVVRGDGNAVTVEYARNGYDRLQLHDPETGNLLYAWGLGTAWNTTISKLPVPSGALELRLGHGVGDQRYANMVVRERAVVAANPGYATVDLSLRPH
jgi:hypothetical protein